MAAITAAVAIGAVAVGAAAYEGEAKKGAAADAAKAQTDALNGVQYLDINKLNSDALAADSAKFQNQFALQEKYDPTVANLRTQGASGVLDGLKDNPDENSLLHQLAQAGTEDSPKRDAIINQLMDGAQTELNAGATLPPEFQQELVRSGLESTGAAGTTGSGAAGVQARTLLGSAGIALQQQRQTQATGLLSAADSLRQNRAAILSNALAGVEQANNAQQGRQINAFQIGAAGVPNAGLSGADVTNLALQNTQLHNQVTLGKGNVNANLALANGAANAQMAAGIAGGVTGAIGGVGGGGGGMISGLMGSGGGGMTTPQYNTYPSTNGFGYTSYGRGSYLA